MLVIKRYPNRKLYDTEAKQYITLEGIADLIRQGREVQVIDHTSGEDLTALTLTQIILEQERKQAGFLPRSVLAGLVKAGGNTLSTLRRSLATPLEMLRHIDDEIERRIEVLISRGELAEEEAMRMREKLLTRRNQPEEASWLEEADLERLLEARGVPTRQDVQKLSEQLEALNAKLDSIHQSDS